MNRRSPPKKGPVYGPFSVAMFDFRRYTSQKDLKKHLCNRNRMIPGGSLTQVGPAIQSRTVTLCVQLRNLLDLHNEVRGGTGRPWK